MQSSTPFALWVLSMTPSLINILGTLFSTQGYNLQTAANQGCWTKSPVEYQKLPKAQETQGIEHFDSFNTVSEKEKLRQALKSFSNFSLFCLVKGEKYIEQLWQSQLTALVWPYYVK